MKTIICLLLVTFAMLILCVAATAQVSVVQDAPVQLDTMRTRGLHAVALVSTPDTGSTYLLGSAVIDHRSAGFVKTNWSRFSGPSCQIEKPDSLGTRVFKMIAGTYRFRFIVTDTRIPASDTSYMNVILSH